MASDEGKELSASEEQRMDEYEDDEMEAAGEGEGEGEDHEEFLAEAAAHLAATAEEAKAAADPSAVGAALAPLKPSLQHSGTSQLAAAMSSTHVGAPAAAAAVPFGKHRTAATVSATGGDSVGGIGEEETDEESDDELNEEQQEKVAHVKKVEVVIADAKAAGFTFSNQTGWSAAEAYVNYQHLFDEAGVNITECVKEGKKQINLKQVEEKLAELRAAVEEAAVAPYAGGLSQELIGESESEEEEEEEESEDEFNGLSKQTLESKKEQLEIDIGVAEAKKDDGRFGGPVKIAHRKFNKELVSFKNSPVYDAKVNPHPHPNPNP